MLFIRKIVVPNNAIVIPINITYQHHVRETYQQYCFVDFFGTLYYSMYIASILIARAYILYYVLSVTQHTF